MQITYENLLHDFAIHVGIEPAALLSAQGMLIDGVAIGFKHDGEGPQGDVLYFSTLGTPHPSHLDQISRQLLEANHFCIGADGCTLGVQAETGAVTLCGRRALQVLDAETLALLLNEFIDTATYWKQVVDGAAQPQSQAAPDSMAFDFRQFA